GEGDAGRYLSFAVEQEPGMMTTGRIQFAESDGTFVLKFLGDVRLTLCAALDAYIKKIVSAMHFKSIVIDLTETDNIDSTSLGLLAKLSILSRERVGLLPTLVSTQQDMLRLLQSMGFDQIIIIMSVTTLSDAEFEVLLLQTLSVEEVRARVLESHRLLMDLNEHNRYAFVDLVTRLEGDTESDDC